MAKRRASSTPDDAVSRYAERVLSGAVVAGPHVRDACRRHFSDLEHGHERGLEFRPKEVERVIRFFREVLTVEVEEMGDDGLNTSRVIPFELHESQEFIVGSLFGWYNERGHRRFRRAFVEEGKGNGKSPLAAGVGHYMLTATRKIRAEVYSAATDKDQAAILFRDAVEMYRRSPELYARLHPSGQNPIWQLTYHDTQSFFKPISSEKKGKSGIRPYCSLIDEVHEHPDDSVIEMLRAGTKGNQDALMLEITNSGSDKTSVCWEEHDYTIKICSGLIENDAWFGYVCALDEEEKDANGNVIREADDPFNDESCWIKANPLLGVSVQPEYIREQVREAEGLPSKENTVRRLSFCQWSLGAEGWLGRNTWERAESLELRIEDYIGELCYAGLDLSLRQALSALALVFPTGPETADAFVYFWKPKDGLNEAITNDRQPYDVWNKGGYLFLTPGKVIKLKSIAEFMNQVAKDHDLQGIAHDSYRHPELAEDLLDMGIELPLLEHPQGFRRVAENPLWMPSSVQHTENALIENRLRVCYNPLLRYNVASVVVRQDPAGTDNRILDKRKSRARIDGATALCEAVGLWQARMEKGGGKSFWET